MSKWLMFCIFCQWQQKISYTIFQQIFIFHKTIVLQKLWKMFFILSKKLFFCSWVIQIFVFPSSPFFLLVSHCFRTWSKTNLKVYDLGLCFHFYSPKRRLWKDKFSQQHFRKISWTLSYWHVNVKTTHVLYFLSMTAKNRSHYFSTNFHFSPNDSPSKTMKDVFYFTQKAFFCSWVIQIFVFPSSPFFLLVSHCFRTWSKINIKGYDVINCLNKNLITHFVWYLEKEKRYDTDRVLKLVSAIF